LTVGKAESKESEGFPLPLKKPKHKVDFGPWSPTRKETSTWSRDVSVGMLQTRMGRTWRRAIDGFQRVPERGARDVGTLANADW